MWLATWTIHLANHVREAVGRGLHFVAVRLHHHPVDRGSRRRDEAVADPIPPRVEGGKMLLRHGSRVARSRVAADLARKARQHADGQHRRQLVPPPLGMAEVGDPLQRLQQRRKRLFRRLHRRAGHRPVRMRLRRAKPGHRRAAQRVDNHLLQLAMRIRVAAPAACIALGEPHRRPVGGSVHRSVVLLRIHKGLRQFQRMAVGRLAVGTQAAEHPADKAAARVREGARLRMHQQARIARNNEQPLILLRSLPADEPVSRTALQRACLPACKANPQRPKDRNIPESPSHKTHEAELVVLGHQTVPGNAFLRSCKPNHNIRHRGIRRQTKHAIQLAGRKREVQTPRVRINLEMN